MLNDNLIEYVPDLLYNLTNLELHLENNKLHYLSKKILNIKKSCISANSYYNLNDLPNNTEYLQINELDVPLLNLPCNLKEIRLYDPIKVNIKVPFGCSLFINDFMKK